MRWPTRSSRRSRSITSTRTPARPSSTTAPRRWRSSRSSVSTRASSPVSGTKAFTAHPLGATGAIEAAICALALEHRWIPPTLESRRSRSGLRSRRRAEPRPRRRVELRPEQFLRLRRNQRLRRSRARAETRSGLALISASKSGRFSLRALRRLFFFATPRSRRDSRRAKHPALSIRETPLAACIADLRAVPR